MKFKVKAKTMFVDAEAKKTRDHGEEFVVSATRYALMDERKLVDLIEQIEEEEIKAQAPEDAPAEESVAPEDAPAEESVAPEDEPAGELVAPEVEEVEEPVKPKRSRKTTKGDA